MCAPNTNCQLPQALLSDPQQMAQILRLNPHLAQLLLPLLPAGYKLPGLS
jgi:hypothetical protein